MLFFICISISHFTTVPLLQPKGQGEKGKKKYWEENTALLGTLLEHRKLPPQSWLPGSVLISCSFKHPHVPGTWATAKRLPVHSCSGLLASIIGIISLVVHYQLVVNKVEAVRTSLIRIFNHQTNCKSGKGKSKDCV